MATDVPRRRLLPNLKLVIWNEDDKVEKAVIFGAGQFGKISFEKLKYLYDIAAFADNNSQLWGATVLGVPVVSPQDLAAMDALVFISPERYWRDIAEQLDGLGVRYAVLNAFLSYQVIHHRIYPLHLGNLVPYKKDLAKEFSVLFVQQTLCARTNKIAAALKSIGVKTYAAFQITPAREEEAFFGQMPIFSYGELLEYVNSSEFDIIHCSNEDDSLTSLLTHSNKTVIFDCHDVVSESYSYIPREKFLLEYIASTRSDGVLIFSEEAKAVLCKKYDLSPEKVLAVGNYPSAALFPTEKVEKLSAKDGEIHCVYEGGLIFEENSTVKKYYLRDLFAAFAQAGVHVHFYCPGSVEQCCAFANTHPLLHFEGSLSGTALITQMQKYDLGFAMFNISEGVMYSYLQMCSPNKLFEYLAAGLPFITNVDTFSQFGERYGCGQYIDMAGDIAAQCRAAMGITIEENFLEEHGFTMDANAPRILEFYQKIKGKRL